MTWQNSDEFEAPGKAEEPESPFPTYNRATTLQGSHSKSPFLSSMQQSKLKSASQALSTRMSSVEAKSRRARQSSYKFGR